MIEFETAKLSLEQNIIRLGSRYFLTAGQHQFKTLWTRDFCHSVRGLLAIGREDVARDHLGYLLENLREDGLVPRVLDNLPVQLRVALQTLKVNLPLTARLMPQYIDEHGSNAFDSNVLVVLACLQMPKDFQKQYEKQILRAWRWYDDKFKDGLIYQTPFSDWQDTTKREGHTFLLNLFYYLASARLGKDHPELKEKLKTVFLKDGVFISHLGSPQVSVEGNLFALEASEFLNPFEKEKLWQNLKAHPVIALDGVIGRCSYPDWPASELAWHIKVAQLERYHGSLTWSWIAGLGLKVALLMKDQEMIQRQKLHIQRLLRSGEVHEVYDPDSEMRPWRSWLIEAEHPFAWGAGYLAEVFNYALPRLR